MLIINTKRCSLFAQKATDVRANLHLHGIMFLEGLHRRNAEAHSSKTGLLEYAFMKYVTSILSQL